MICNDWLVVGVLLGLDLIKAPDVVEPLLDHVGLQFFTISPQLVDYLHEQGHPHAVDVVVKGIVQRLEDIAVVDQGNHDLIELFESLKHVQAHLEGRCVVLGVWISLALLATDFDEDARELQGVSQHMVLHERLQQSEVILLQDVLGEHGLLRWTLWDLVLHEAPVVLLNDGQAVSARERLELTWIATQDQTGGVLSQGLGFLLVKHNFAHIDELPESVLDFILEYDYLT